MLPQLRSGAERLGAWAVTGPPGHLWSFLGDVVALLARHGARRIVRRVRALRAAR